MSNLDADLTLHLALDEINDGNVSDRSAGRRSLSVAGTPKLVPDPEHGVCLSFDGVDDVISLPPDVLPTGNEVTVCFWAKGGDKLPIQTSFFYGAGAAGANGQAPRLFNVHLPWSDENVYFDCGSNGSNFDRLQKAVPASVYKGEWQHWAFTKKTDAGDGQPMKIYLNGALLAGGGGTTPLTAAAAVTLGGVGGVGGTYWQGLAAHLRVYRRALAATDIARIMVEDAGAAAVYRRSHPLSFNLLDDNNQQALYITDRKDLQNLTLEIHNTSARDVVLNAPASADVTGTNHHFELRFRPGTLNTAQLSAIQLDATTAAAGWKLLAAAPSGQPSSLYFLHPQAATLPADGRLSLRLVSISADGRGGARGTRVELRCGAGQVAFATGSGGLIGSSIQHLNVSNAVGVKELSARLDFVSPRTVLNDGRTPNTCLLSFTNVSQDTDLALVPHDGAPGGDYSKFILSFERYDSTEDNQWALSKQDTAHVQVAVVKAASGRPSRYDKDGDWIVQPVGAPGQNPQWEIAPRTKQSLAHGGSFLLQLDGIVSDLASGPTNVYLQYVNLPDHWDGQLVTTLEKGPLVINDRVDNNGNRSQWVGVGTNKPQGKLDVNGALVVLDNGYVGVGTGNPGVGLQVAQGRTLRCDLGTGSKVSLGGNGSFEVDAPGVSAGRFVVADNGNVGVGVAQPASRLEVNGTTVLSNGGSWATHQGYMAPGSLSVGSTNTNYGGGNNWSGNTAALLLETSANTEVAVHDSGTRVASLLYYEGDNTNRITLGRDMGWGTIGQVIMNGHVGIGTTSPGWPLEVNNVLKLTNGSANQDDGTFAAGVHMPGLNIIGIDVGGRRKIGVWGEFTQYENGGTNSWGGQNCFGGNVGIGTNSPTSPLHVTTWNNIHMETGFWFAFLNEQRNSHNTYDNSVSIHAAQGVLSDQAFYITSDRRIKKDLQTSDPRKDLELLGQLRVTDFSYVDFVRQGGNTRKGFIAQEVQEVFPQAVIQQTGVVPDIYRPAPLVDGWVSLDTDLKQGERVRLIDEAGAESLHEVLEKAGDRFRVADQPGGEKVFVFGREVPDFLTVDYDALAVLNVSATQQIKRDTDARLAALEQENATLKARLARLEEVVDLLLARRVDAGRSDAVGI